MLVIIGGFADVGFGCGDSLILYLTSSAVPIPETLAGVTSLESHYIRAQRRISFIQNSLSKAYNCRVKLWHDDAVYSPTKSPADHPLDPLLSEPLYTTITAIDCAYHFASRELFLQQCFARLAPGGRVALGDLVTSRPLPVVLGFLASNFLSVRRENMLTVDQYRDQLVRIGYVDISFEDISNHVFPSFSDFLRSKGGLWLLMASMFGWWSAAGGRFVIVGASKPSAT